MKKLLLVFLLIAQCCNAVFAQAYKTNPPKLPLSPQANESGMSDERLLRIDKTVLEYINKKWLNGAVAIITTKHLVTMTQIKKLRW